MTKPILFLDVDGPLNPYEMLSKGVPGYTLHQMRPGPPWDDERNKPLPVLLNHDHGRRLLELDCDIIWSTSWKAGANEWIGPHIGLPELPFVEYTAPYRRKDPVHEKVRAMIRTANGRPFVWVDDEASSDDWQFIKTVYGPHGEIYRASPRTGLMNADFFQLARKLKEVQENAGPEHGVAP